MIPEPQSNDAPVSGAAYHEALRQASDLRAELEQAKRERDKLATVLAQAEEAACSNDIVGAIRHNWKAFQKQAQLLERYRTALTDMTRQRDEAVASRDGLIRSQHLQTEAIGTAYRARDAALAQADALRKELGNLIPSECPWPESVWTMTVEQYQQSIPDDRLRTAISGLLMRMGWNVAVDYIGERLSDLTDDYAQPAPAAPTP